MPTDQKNIQELNLKISGKIPIQRQLELGEEYRLLLKIGIVKQEIGDNQDGSVNITDVAKVIDVEIVR